MSFLDNPIFICGHRKSGTTMLINLFDGAKDAVVFPDDSGFFYMYYPTYESSKYTDSEKVMRLAERIVKIHLSEKIEEAKCDDNTKKILYENQNIFYNKVKSFNQKDFHTEDILKHFIQSFHESFYPDNVPKVWIEKTTSTEIYAVEIVKWYPNAKFIHILRDPRDNWSSLKSGWDKKYQDYNDSVDRLKHSMIERGLLGFEMAIYNEKIIGKERYKVVKYEDFVQDSERYMQEFAEFVGIEYNDNLLKPTTFGMQWEGNNFEGIKNIKPSAINVNKWKNRISDEDAALMEFYFKDVMNHFNYELFFTDEQRQKASIEHYKWYNFSTPYKVD